MTPNVQDPAVLSANNHARGTKEDLPGSVLLPGGVRRVVLQSARCITHNDRKRWSSNNGDNAEDSVTLLNRKLVSNSPVRQNLLRMGGAHP